MGRTPERAPDPPTGPRLAAGRPARGTLRLACATVAVLALLASAADAQPRRLRAPREPRVIVTLGAGGQTSGDATDRVEWPELFEPAVADVSYRGGTGRWLSGGAGVRLWRRVGVGVAVSSARRDGTASIDARIPHPFFFDQPRGVSGEAAQLSRSETGVHFQVLYLLPATGRVRVVLSAGPSRMTARQDTVTAVRYAEDYPFDAATFERADTLSLSASAIGFNAGAEAAYMFTRTLGVAGLIRVTGSSIRLTRPDGGRLPLDAGGFKWGGGVRVGF